MKKKLLPLAVATTLTFSLTAPYAGHAGKLDDEIKDLRQEVKQKQEKQKALKQQIKENEQKQKSVNNKLDELAASLEKTKEKIRQLHNEITQTEDELEEAKKKLQEAEERVAKRDKLFQERIRLMYDNGQVSYLEVLLGAKDFGDFLARFESIQTIMEQDKELLEAQKRDRDIIAESKQKIETALAKLNTLQAKAEEERKVLAEKQQEQKVALASLKQSHSDLEDHNEKEEQKERDLAAKLAAKEDEKRAQEAPKTTVANGPTASGSGSASFSDSGGTLAWPVSGRVSSGFGMRGGRMHKGIDIAAPVGTPIYAAADGTVTLAGRSSGYGNRITISHGNGLSTLYGHMYDNGLLVSAGQKVKRGQKIAVVGNFGRSTGPHLHFEVLNGGSAVNPMGYLR